MYIVTFYSYRGAVGRTTALVNVGLELARRGRKVLLVDFDLEKPDLPSFPPLAKAVSQAGIVEYVSAYRESGVMPNIQEYLCPLEPAGARGGRIWVMPAGKSDGSQYWSEYMNAPLRNRDFDPRGKGGPEYWKMLAEIDWQTLYDQEQGYLFFERTREQWQELGVDYVLIDTHAGITPSLGITTRQLADAVVMMYNPHQEDQDRSDGVRMRSGFDDVSWLIDGEAEQTGRKPIEQLFVASQVLDADNECKVDYENEIHIFGYAAVIPFSHRLLLGESVIEQERQERLSKDRLAREYRRLANAIIKANFTEDKDGARVILCDIHSKPPGALLWERFTDQDAILKLKQFTEVFQEDAAIQAQAACLFFASHRYAEALHAMDCAVEAQPNAPKLRWQRASYRRRVGMKTGAVEDLLRLLDLSSRSSNPHFDVPNEFKDESGLGYRRLFPDRSDPLIELEGADRYTVSALWKLRELDETKYEEAKRKPCFTSLSPEMQRRIFAGPRPVEREVNPVQLIRRKEWEQVMAYLQPLIGSSPFFTFDDAFHLFIASWALRKDESVWEYGTRAKARFHELLEFCPQDLSPSHFQMMSLIFWKTGELEEALKCLDIVIDETTWPEVEFIFSAWLYEFVSWNTFQANCRLQRQMFKVDNSFPPVIGEQPSH